MILTTIYDDEDKKLGNGNWLRAALNETKKSECKTLKTLLRRQVKYDQASSYIKLRNSLLSIETLVIKTPQKCQ